MKKFAGFLSAVLSFCLCLGIVTSLPVTAYGATGNGKLIFGLPSDDSSEKESVGVSDKSMKDRLEECQQKYRDYQDDSKYVSKVGTTMPDGFSLVRTINKEIRQVQVFSPIYYEAKIPENSCYSPLEDYSVIYYYDDGLPFFALCYNDNTSSREEYRFYLSQGEIIQWIDDDGETSNQAPDEFFFLYDHAMAAYSRAMYDRYDKGNYAIQVGSFKDKEQAEDCRDSMLDEGQDARVESIDNVYCVLIGKYKDWDKAAEAFEDVELTDLCGTTYIRLV